MSTVAEKLRQAREAQKMTIHQVAEITKIRTDHLRALEEGNFDVFSAPVYIRGFIRTYATLLKLDVPQTMSALDAELGQTEKFREPPPLSEEPKGALDFLMLQLSKVDWRKGMILLAGVAILVIVISIFVASRRHSTADPLSGLQPGVYKPGLSSTGETLPVPPVRK